MSTLSVFDQDGRPTGTFENMFIENSGKVIEIIESNIEFKKDNAFVISTNVEIKAGATRKETITLFTPKRD